MICLPHYSGPRGLLDLGSQLHTGYWPEASLISSTQCLSIGWSPTQKLVFHKMIDPKKSKRKSGPKQNCGHLEPNLGSAITSLLSYSVRSKSQNPALVKGNYTRAWMPGSGGHLGDTLPHKHTSDSVPGWKPPLHGWVTWVIFLATRSILVWGYQISKRKCTMDLKVDLTSYCPLFAASGNHHSTLWFHEFDYYGYLI